MKINRDSRHPIARRSRKIGVGMSKKLVGLFALVILALVLLAIRITYINFTDGEQYSRIVLSQAQQRMESRTIPYRRGDILDRNGTILATSEKVYNLILDCQVVNYERDSGEGTKSKPYYEATVNALHDIFDIPTDDIRGVLDGEDTKDRRYYILKDGVSISDKKAFEEYTDIDSEANQELSGEAKEQRSRIKGVWFEDDYKRSYPLGSLACDTIGFTYTANEAEMGIEGYYSDVLNGTDGRQYGYYDTENNEDSYVVQSIVDAKDGNNVISTIDVNIQQIIREAIISFNEEIAVQQGIEVSGSAQTPKGAENIAVIVMDPNNGEILGMDSTEWYDLNEPRDISAYYSETETANMTDTEKMAIWNQLWRNYCVTEAFEPGSTVKAITAAAALETGSVTGSEIFNCDGYEQVADRYIGCVAGHGDETLAEAIKYSCNDVLMQVAAKMGGTNLIKYQDLFKFGKKTGIDLPGEVSGMVFDENTMGEVELATSSFGQGFTCTMMQEAAAVCAIINGGTYYTPHVVSEITDSEGTVITKTDSTVERRVVSQVISDYLREAMGMVVEDVTGTGHSAKIDGYSMGGKTGTAQKLPREDENYLVSFLGFAPLENPQVMVYVVVDQPHAEKQDTSAYAITISRKIMTELLPYMNMFPDEALTGNEEGNAEDTATQSDPEAGTPDEETASDGVQDNESGSSGGGEDEEYGGGEDVSDESGGEYAADESGEEDYDNN